MTKVFQNFCLNEPERCAIIIHVSPGVKLCISADACVYKCKVFAMESERARERERVRVIVCTLLSTFTRTCIYVPQWIGLTCVNVCFARVSKRCIRFLLWFCVAALSANVSTLGARPFRVDFIGPCVWEKRREPKREKKTHTKGLPPPLRTIHSHIVL